MNFNNKRVLVTGGSGCIGGRIIEKLILEPQVKLRVLVHNCAHAVRIARLPVELYQGDLLNPTAVKEAAQDCDIIIHCAYGNSHDPDLQRRVTVDGTRHLLDAALEAGVERFVHFSTVMVYGPVTAGEITEESPRQYWNNDYANSKLQSEELVFDYFRRYALPITVLQPCAVYGPFAQAWTVNVLQQLMAGRVILPDSGRGLRNIVYLDDIVNATLLAATTDAAVGESFLVSDGVPITYRQFYQSFEDMLDMTATVSMTSEEAANLYLQSLPQKPHLLPEFLQALKSDSEFRRRIMRTKEINFVRRRVRRLLPTALHDYIKQKIKMPSCVENPTPSGNKPIFPLHPTAIQLYTGKATVRIDKARRLLGFEPVFDIDTGMRLTANWAKWANLIPARTKPGQVAHASAAGYLKAGYGVDTQRQ